MSIRYTARHRASGTPCEYCRRTMDIAAPDIVPTKDHVHPKSLGGTSKVWACWTCNHVKDNMTLPEWQAFMGANPEWWTKVRRVTTRGHPIIAGRTPLPFSRSTRLLVSDDPLVRAVLDRFPGATITDIRQSAVDTEGGADSAPPSPQV